MKFRVTMKTPDALEYAIENAVNNTITKEAFNDTIDDDDLENMKLEKSDDFLKICEKWFDCLEYLTIEIDTDLKTCVVIPRHTIC